ncbi:MAG: hypothetical protein ACMG6E_02225 [Candidatus Roizmanbacteria bacterium]
MKELEPYTKLLKQALQLFDLEPTMTTTKRMQFMASVFGRKYNEIAIFIDPNCNAAHQTHPLLVAFHKKIIEDTIQLISVIKGLEDFKQFKPKSFSYYPYCLQIELPLTTIAINLDMCTKVVTLTRGIENRGHSLPVKVSFKEDLPAEDIYHDLLACLPNQPIMCMEQKLALFAYRRKSAFENLIYIWPKFNKYPCFEGVLRRGIMTLLLCHRRLKVNLPRDILNLLLQVYLWRPRYQDFICDIDNGTC